MAYRGGGGEEGEILTAEKGLFERQQHSVGGKERDGIGAENGI